MSLPYRVVRKLGFFLRLRLENEPGPAWRALVALLAMLMRLLGWTLRIRADDKGGYLDGRVVGPVIVILWHNRIFGIPHGYQRRATVKRKALVLTSLGPEGSLLALLLSHFGVGAVRGSTSRGASAALREMEKRLAEGYDIVITPDGPRGPRYGLQPGALYVAQRTRRPILPMHIEYSRYVRFKTWDGFAAPLPFARLDARIGEPVYIPPDLSKEEFEAMRLRLEDLMTRSMLMDGARRPD